MALDAGTTLGPYQIDVRSNPRTSQLAPDGRFLLVRPYPLPPIDRSHVNLVFNWFEELNARVPTP